MGINRQTLELLINENNHKNISGNFLSIGKQTVNVDLLNAIELFQKYSLSTKELEALYAFRKFDTSTRHAAESILDNDLLSCFSTAKYHCLDRSTYEGATLIHDMNKPISRNLCEEFDFIYNGSCMDNIFDPVSFIRNTSEMLKTGGRVVHIECATGVPGAYLMFSPEWFFSYYALNNFIDCKVYVTVAKEDGKTRHIFDADWFSWQPFFSRQDNYSDIKACRSIEGLMHVIVIAEKGSQSSSHLCPIQMQYLDEKAVDWRKKYYEYKMTGRVLIKPNHRKDDEVLPYLTDHYEYLGSDS